MVEGRRLLGLVSLLVADLSIDPFHHGVFFSFIFSLTHAHLMHKFKLFTISFWLLVCVSLRTKRTKRTKRMLEMLEMLMLKMFADVDV